jgi:hypothetical protein
MTVAGSSTPDSRISPSERAIAIQASVKYLPTYPIRPMFDLISYHKFRDTPSVRFFDITIPNSNGRDLVFHDGPATSPNNAEDGSWQFYLHPHQEDNLLAVSGGRTFYLVNFAWASPFHMVRLEANGDILRIPPGTFHRSVSDRTGSLVLNQAVRSAQATIEREFRVYNSAMIPKLKQITSPGSPLPLLHGFPEEDIRAA